MKKTNRISRYIAVLLALVMVLVALPTTAFAGATDDFSVVVSMEGLTIGQGIYIEPEVYTLTEINNLVASEGYGPYSEDDLTAGMATLAMIIDKGLEYTSTGSWDSDIYLSSVKGIDNGVVDIPQFITENGGPSNDDYEENTDEYLGEFDYSSMSGWMITVNDYMIPVGCGNYNVSDGAVVRWQFTLWGYGADLGVDTGWGMPAYFTAANKADLYTAYANCTSASAKASVKSVMGNLTASQAEVDNAITTLTAGNQPKPAQDVSAVLNATMAQMAATVTEPVFASVGGEWTVISLARGDYYPTGNTYFENYYKRIVDTVNTTAASVTLQNGALHKVKSTENSRLIMALSAIGKNPEKVGNWNLITPFEDFTWIKKQGINGPIFALIALDSKNYQTEDTTIRQQCIDYILGKQLADGGWALSGTTADPDITAMALQSLAPYKAQSAVMAAATIAFDCLSAMQKDSGGYASWGSVNVESIAQVIVACTAWGINPDTDSRFIKNDNSCVDALLTFYLEADNAFCHVANGGSNAMATDQACYALVAYQRFLASKNTLYDMTDVIVPESKELSVSLSLPEKIENDAGTTFNAVMNLSNWDASAGYKLMDCIINVPSELTVTGVTIGNRVGGGQVSYHLEESTSKLRIVYFDAQSGNNLTLSGEVSPAEYLTIGFSVKEKIDVALTDKLTVSIAGMSFKKNSDSSDTDSMTAVNVTDGSDTVTVVKGISFSTMSLYTGDGVDLISSSQTAIAVAVTGVPSGAKITYTGNASSIELKYNAALSEKTGVSTYVCMIPSSVDVASFADKANFTVSGGTAQTLTFGDSNNDGIVNAQDALNAVNDWLRKSEAPSDNEILALNINADARLNTFDALGIVEHFVNGDEFVVITKAAALKEVID